MNATKRIVLVIKEIYVTVVECLLLTIQAVFP